MKNTRRTVIAGNWKMNKTPSLTTEFVKELIPEVSGAKCDVIICTPFVCLQNAVAASKGTNIKVGAENIHFEASGAFTGEISADMLKDLGVEYVIIGHSERRQYFAETDETVNLKMKASIAAGLKPIVCVGELLSQREAGITAETVSIQVKKAFCGISGEDASKVIIAYEPVWAIGTGKTATSDEADEVCGIIRGVIGTLYGKDTAECMSVLYGGSMNAKNAAELLAKDNVDGGLIGGASLKSVDFGIITKAATK